MQTWILFSFLDPMQTSGESVAEGDLRDWQTATRSATRPPQMGVNLENLGILNATLEITHQPDSDEGRFALLTWIQLTTGLHLSASR